MQEALSNNSGKGEHNSISNSQELNYGFICKGGSPFHYRYAFFAKDKTMRMILGIQRKQYLTAGQYNNAVYENPL